MGVRASFRQLTEQEKDALVFIEAYDFGKIRARVLKDGSVEISKVDLAIAEFCKFVALISLGYTELAMMNGDVDEIWHTLILHTADYETFCNQVAGRFIHHRPATSDSPVPDGAKKGFVTAYTEVFGGFAKIWGIGADCDYAKCDFAGCADCDPSCQ